MKRYFILIIISLLAPGSLFSQSFLISTDSTNFPAVEMEEVSVISSKEVRNNKIMELPVSVSLINSEKIEQQEILKLNDLSGMVPNLFMPDYGTKLTSPIYLRGIGSRINSPSVGLYVDNVPYFEKASFDFDFFNIEKIEVLRGPQGTLYGRNTMGGIVNIYTREPSRTRETEIDLSAGSYNHLKAILSHNQPLGDRASLLLNASAFNFGGSFENQFTQRNVDAINSYSGRIKLLYQATRRIKTEYSMNFEKSRQDGYPYALFNDSSMTTGEVNYDHSSNYNRFMISNNFLVKYMAGNFNIISTTSHQYFEGLQDIDQDFTPASLLSVSQDQAQHMLSQEISIHSSGQSDYSYLFGIFGFTQLLDSRVDVIYQEDGIARFRLPGPMEKIKTYDNQNSGAAIFHQSTLNNFLIPDLSLVGGIRIDYENAGQVYNYDMILSGTQNDVDDFNQELQFFEILPKAALHYKLTEGISTFATITKGYKTGGFNTTFEREEDESFLPEFSWNYEAGIKTELWNQNFHFNLAAFYIDWKNQQIYQAVPSGQGSMIKNAGHSYSKGLEIEAKGSPLKNLNIFANLGLNDAKFIKYEEDDVTNYNDHQIPYVPAYTLYTGGDYRFEMNNEFFRSVMLQLNYRRIGKHYWDEDNLDYQKAYGLLNSKIKLMTKNIDISLWGKNLLNQQYNSFYFTALGNAYAQKGRPLMLGTSLNVRF